MLPSLRPASTTALWALPFLGCWVVLPWGAAVLARYCAGTTTRTSATVAVATQLLEATLQSNVWNNSYGIDPYNGDPLLDRMGEDPTQLDTDPVGFRRNNATIKEDRDVRNPGARCASLSLCRNEKMQRCSFSRES